MEEPEKENKADDKKMLLQRGKWNQELSKGWGTWSGRREREGEKKEIDKGEEDER